MPQRLGSLDRLRAICVEFPEVTEGKIVELWKRGFYKVAWESGLTYQGKTTIVSGNVIRKKPR